MNQGHGLAMISGGRRRAERSGSENAPTADFWPEVSGRNSREDLVHIKPENSPGRVFLEVLLVLGVAGLMAVAAAVWIPILS